MSIFEQEMVSAMLIALENLSKLMQGIAARVGSQASHASQAYSSQSFDMLTMIRKVCLDTHILKRRATVHPHIALKPGSG